MLTSGIVKREKKTKINEARKLLKNETLSQTHRESQTRRGEVVYGLVQCKVANNDIANCTTP
jgi:hypothetical protein